MITSTGDCEKCGKPMVISEGDGKPWHASVIDMFICDEVKVVAGEDFAARMARQSKEALKAKDWGTT